MAEITTEDLARFQGYDASIQEFSTQLESILRLHISDFHDDGWVVSFIGVERVSMQPKWKVGQLEIIPGSGQLYEFRDTANQITIVFREIAMIPEEEYWDHDNSDEDNAPQNG
jgi:hypothetical protein